MAASTADASSVDLTENHNATIIAVTAIFCTLSTTAVVMRLWSKSMKGGIRADDFFLVASQIVVLAWNIMTVSAIRWAGLGYHGLALSPSQILNFTKLVFASGFIQPTSLALAKISMLLLLNHLFPGRAFRWTVRILASVVIAWWLTLMLGNIFICLPVNSHWNSTVAAHCGNEQAFNQGTPIPWILTDIAILVAPLPVLKQLQLPRAQKWGLIGLFLVGVLTCVVSIIRYSTLWYSITDAPFDIVPAALWGVVETNITSFCAAIIACRPVLTLLSSSKLISSISRRYFTNGSSTSRSRSGYKKSKDTNEQSSNPYGMDTPLTDLSRNDKAGTIQVTNEMKVEYENPSGNR